MLHLAQLYGHIHSDRMKLQYLKDTGDEQTSSVKSFLLTAPSITPVYGSNPAFRMYDYDPNQKSLSNYDQYYLDLAASNGKKSFYSFEIYPSKGRPSLFLFYFVLQTFFSLGFF